jgi:hypothetical protein
MISSVTAARVAAGAALACGALLLAACGSTAAPSAGGTTTKTVTATPHAGTPSPSASADPAPSSSSAAPACATAILHLRLGASNGAAGSTVIPLEFINESNQPCALYGYPGVSFVTKVGGGQIGNPASRDPASAASQVTLAASGTAHALLQVAVAQNYPTAKCHPVTAHWLKVYPPGQTAPLYVNFTSSTCTAKSIHVLSVQTVQPGNGNNS